MGDSTGWAIVAIPTEDDYVWKISSEKIPHLTLLYLGQQAQNAEKEAHIAEFLQHVAKTAIPRFGMEVDHRGALGPDEADVLFFEKRFAKDIADARSYLLKDETIFEMYNSTEQYPEWTPHLTLGYPATPAKADKRDYPGITWVNFDKIALWTGDYVGPTFDLKREDWSVGEVAMSDFGRLLTHHGIKGMHWGVRRPVGSNGLVKKSGSEAAKASGSSSSGHPSADQQRVTKAFIKSKVKGKESLSNEELKLITNRLKAEKELNQLTSDQKSSLQKQVEQLRLEKEYRQLSAEKAMAERSTGRKILDSILASASKQLQDVVADQAASYGKQLTEQLLAGSTGKTSASTASNSASKARTAFKVNPDKVRFGTAPTPTTALVRKQQ